MIELTAGTACMIYLAMTLFLLLGFWVYQHYRYRDKKITTPEKNLLVCEYCHFAYLKDSAKKISKCPQCQSLNQ